jgi:hypothetical protein
LPNDDNSTDFKRRNGGLIFMKSEEEIKEKAIELAKNLIIATQHPGLMMLADWRKDRQEELANLELLAWVLDKENAQEIIDEIPETSAK